MKTQKILNKVLVILIVVLLSLVSFGGIYYSDKGQMSSRIPGYVLDADLVGYRQVTLSVDDTVEEETDEESEEQSNETTENNEISEGENTTTETTNKKEYTTDDYKKTVETMKKRLKSLGIQNYQLMLDESTGRIVIRLPENQQTDIVLSDLTEIGKFSIRDSATDEELLNNSDIKSVNIGLSGSAYSTSQSIVMSINFNSKGTKKFKKVTEDYHNVANEATVQSNETTDITETANETNIAEIGNETNTTTTTEDTKKEVKISIDSTEMLTTNFDEIIENGTLSLTVGVVDDEFDTQMYSALNLAALIENKPLDVEYKISGNTYVDAAIEDNSLKAIVCIEIAVALIILLVMVVKYRLSGILRAIMSVGYIAILLLAIRYTNVTLSLEGIFAIELGFIINAIFEFLILKEEKDGKLNGKEKKNTFNSLVKKYTLMLVPISIVALVFCFTQWAGLLSLGMIMFWSILISWIYNILVNKFVI